MSSLDIFPAQGPKWRKIVVDVAILCSDKREPAAVNCGGACEDEKEE